MQPQLSSCECPLELPWSGYCFHLASFLAYEYFAPSHEVLPRLLRPLAASLPPSLLRSRSLGPCDLSASRPRSTVSRCRRLLCTTTRLPNPPHASLISQPFPRSRTRSKAFSSSLHFSLSSYILSIPPTRCSKQTCNCDFEPAQQVRNSGGRNRLQTNVEKNSHKCLQKVPLDLQDSGVKVTDSGKGGPGEVERVVGPTSELGTSARGVREEDKGRTRGRRLARSRW